MNVGNFITGLRSAQKRRSQAQSVTGQVTTGTCQRPHTQITSSFHKNWGTFPYIHKNCFMKELHFFTVPLSQKFMFCIIETVTLIFKHHQNLTKLYILKWDTHLLKLILF